MVGGAVSSDALPQLKRINDEYLTRFETRKVVFAASALKRPEIKSLQNLRSKVLFHARNYFQAPFRTSSSECRLAHPVCEVMATPWGGPYPAGPWQPVRPAEQLPGKMVTLPARPFGDSAQPGPGPLPGRGPARARLRIGDVTTIRDSDRVHAASGRPEDAGRLGRSDSAGGRLAPSIAICVCRCDLPLVKTRKRVQVAGGGAAAPGMIWGGPRPW